MKKVRQRITELLLLAIFSAASFSCQKSDDESVDSAYSINDVNKQVVQTVTTNLATGFNSLFSDELNDSASRAAFCQAFTHQARFFADKSGYVFVESVNGYNIAHPALPELEGTSTLLQTDAYGKPIVPKMIELAQFVGYGFLEYAWADPQTNETQTKLTFLASIPKVGWYCGSGFLQSPVTTLYSASQLNERVVTEAVDVMAEGLGAVLVTIPDSLDRVKQMRTLLQHIRFFDDLSGYFYVIDFKGFNVVQPPNPAIQGTDEWDIQDSHGNYLVQGLISTASKGGGFYEYYWINYQTGQEDLKKAYVRQIPGYEYLIGSGMYINRNK